MAPPGGAGRARRRRPPRGPRGQLDVDCVSVRYGGDAVLQEVSLQVAHGAQVAVVGPNGAGKSTLFKALVGLLPLRSGRILVHGRPAGGRADPVAYVPQREEIDWRFPVSVTDVVMMGRYGRTGWLRRPGPADRRAVAAALDLMDLTELARRPISELSGGQQQRVFLARALAQEPHVLLLDEPFTGVDVTARQKTLDVLAELRERDVTVLVSTHDLELAATRFDHVVLLNRRVIAQGPPAFVLTTEHIAEAFGAQAHVFQGMVVIDECCPPPARSRRADVLHWLTDPFTLTFMQRALVASLIVGVLCSVLGCYVVLKSMAFLGDALAHAILPGVAVAYLVGGNLLAGALVAALLVAFAVSFFTHEGTLKEDTAIGILFSAALSLGVVLISTIRTYATDLTHILFGNVLGVSRGDLILTGALAAVSLATVWRSTRSCCW